MNAINILVAEDDTNIRAGLADTLESEGYQVTQAVDGKQAVQLFKDKAIDLVLLDVMMPGKNGYDVCREIRTASQNIPIIMLTAKGEEIDKVVGLQLGADDYITKPFGVHELLARISAVLRRSRIGKSGGPDQMDFFMFGRYRVNPKQYKIQRDDTIIDLSDRELKLIRIFYAHPGEVLSRDYILNEIWGIDYLGTTRTLDQHIAQLRKKIEADPSNPTLITTVHGIGYRYENS